MKMDYIKSNEVCHTSGDTLSCQNPQYILIKYIFLIIQKIAYE